MAPAATPSPNPNDAPVDSPATFGQLLHTALHERTRAGNDPEALLGSGELVPQALCSYAAGRLEGSDREDFESYLSRTPWALERVSALVQGSRPSQANPLAGRILAAAEAGAVDPYREVASALLESLGHADALDNDQPDSEPLVRAACLLGKGKQKLAQEAFAALDSLPSPLAETARRVAHLGEQDEALVELLSSV
jgi:hypothetical protein